MNRTIPTMSPLNLNLLPAPVYWLTVAAGTVLAVYPGTVEVALLDTAIGCVESVASGTTVAVEYATFEALVTLL